MILESTRHCVQQSQRRCIPPIILEWLLEYGASSRSRGAERYYFDKAGRRALERDLGHIAYKRISDLLDAYAVVADDGAFITAGWRYKRIRS